MKYFYCKLLGLLFLYLPFSIQAQNSLLDKNIDINLENASYNKALKKAGKLAEVHFSYNSRLIPPGNITLHENDISLKELLDKIFDDPDIHYKEVNGQLVIFRKNLTASQLTQIVRGSVTDKFSQNPLIGANVVVMGIDPLKASSTDIDGHFLLEEVPVGRYNLKVSFVGYEDQITKEILIGSGKEIVLDLELKESVVTMEALTVRAPHVKTEPINEMALVSARSFSVEETKRYAASIGDPARLALAFAGVTGGRDNSNQLIIRGNSPRGILWRLEGVEIPNPNHFADEGTSSGGISVLSTQMMDNSDFFTGAWPAEYGNATSGVFDIRLRNGNNNKREYTVQAGFLGLDLATEGPFKKEGNSSYLINYRFSTLAILDELGLLGENDEDNIFQDLSLKLNFPTEKEGTFSVFGIGGLSTFDEKTTEFNDHEKSNMGVLGLSHKYHLGNDALMHTVLSVSGSRITNQEVGFGPDTTTDNSDFRKTFTRMNLSVRKKFNARHVLNSGFIYSRIFYNFFEHEVYPGTSLLQFRDFNRFDALGNTGTSQLHASWKYRITENLSLVSGVHFFHFELNNETSLEPRLGAKWQFLPKHSLNAGFGVHSRMETFEYYFGNYIMMNFTTIRFNKDLGLIKSRHYILGYDFLINPSFQLKVEGYYQDLYQLPILENPQNLDQIVFGTNNQFSGFTTFPLINEGTGTNYGVDVSLEHYFKNNYYFLIAASTFESNYQSSDGIIRNTPFNGRFGTTVLGGK